MYPTVHPFLQTQTAAGEIINAVTNIGCFLEAKRHRVFSVNPGKYDPSSLAPRECTTICGALYFRFAATTGNYCFCSNTLPDQSKKKPNEMCDFRCLGDPRSLCGGPGVVSAYNSSKPIIYITLWSVSSRSVVKVGETVRFNYEGKAEVDLVYQLDYGEDAGYTKPNSSHMDMHVYKVPGSYRVVLRGLDQNDRVMPKDAVWQVHVVDHVDDVSLKCQSGFATFEEGECYVTIYHGSELMLSETVGNYTQQHHIPDPIVYYVGSGIPDFIASATTEKGETYGTLYVLANTEFKRPGKIFFWELYAEKKGKIKIAILKPKCNNYCHLKNKCTNSCNHWCEGTPFGDSVFCISKKSCDTVCHSPHRSQATFSNSYIVKQIVTVDATSEGYQNKAAKEIIQVFPGDVLALQFTSSGGRITQIFEKDKIVFSLITNELTSGIQIGSEINMKSAKLLEHKIFYIRAAVSSPLQIRLAYTFLDTGYKIVDINVSSAVSNEFKAVAEKVLVVERINETRINNKRYTATGEETKFVILPHTGTSVKYNWDFGDGIIQNETNLFTITHIYHSKGNFTIRATTWNLRSMRTNTTKIFVQDRLKGLTITVKTKRVLVGTVTVFNMQLKQGSDYICLWDFGDGFKNITTEQETPIGTTDVSHTYKKGGIYTMNITCRNFINEIMQTVFIDSWEYISGLQLERIGAENNEAFRIVCFLASGTHVKFNLVFNNTSLPVKIADAAKRRYHTDILKNLPLGVYDLKLTAANELNSVEIKTKFTVLIAITGLKITSTNLRIPLYKTVTFAVNMDKGSNVEIVWNYDDGMNDTFSLGANDWLGRGPETRTHTFTLAKRHNVTVTVENYAKRIVKTFLVVAIQSVDNVTLEAPVFALFAPPGLVNYTFSILDVQKPNEVSANFQFGDPTDKRNYRFQLELDKPYIYGYRNRILYNMTVELKNDFSYKLFTHAVKIVEPIQNMRIHTNPASAIIGEPLIVKIIMYRGPTGSDCLLQIDFGDDSPPMDIYRKGEGEDGEDIVKVIYNNLTTYTMTVTATTPVQNISVTYDVHVERKVFDMIKFKSNHPVKFGDPVEFYITYPNKPLPTNAYIVFNYGDGTPSVKTPFDFPEGPGGTRTYKFRPKTPGHRKVEIRIYNNGSSVERILEVGSYEPFKDIVITPKFIPALPITALEQNGLEGNNYKFPRNRDVIFNVSMAKGTALFYKMEATGPRSITTCHSTKNPFPCSFNVEGATSGEYSIELRLGNSLFNGSAKTTIFFLDSVYQLQIDDLTPKTSIDDVKTLEVSFNMTGTNSCLYIDFNDSRTIALYSSFPNCCKLSKYEHVQYMGQLMNRFQMNYTYVESGFYTVKALAYNAISNETASISFSISEMDCNKPRVRIHRRSSSIYAPGVFRRGSTIFLSTQTNISCTVTFDNTKHWQMEIIDENWGITVGKIDLKKYKIKTNLAEIIIPPRTLKYGLYKVIYSVEMATKINKGVRFASSSYTYIKIIKSDLVGIMEKGGVTEITRSYGQRVVLNPGKYSYDPDIEPTEEQIFTSFIWSCQDLLEPNERCPHILPMFSAESINFSTSTMKEFGKYELSVTVSKGNRYTVATVILHIVPLPISGGIPSVTIECTGSTKCVQLPKAKLISKTARLGLKCICTDCKSTEQLQYHWTGNLYDYSWPWKPFIKDDLKKYSLGLNNQDISINSRIFTIEDNVKEYRFGCKVTRKGDKDGGEAFLKVTLNTPPVPGSCTIIPRNGTVSWNHNSKFCISCSKWTDDNIIVEYKFYVKKKMNDLEYHITTAEDATKVCVDLPLGAHYDDYREDVWVKVRDSLDAVYAYKIETVQVFPISTKEIREKTIQDVESTNTRLDLLIAEGDQKIITEKLTELGSMLNFDLQQSSLEYSDLPEEVSLYGIDGERFYDGTSNTIGNNTEFLKQAMVEKDNRAKLRTKAVIGCASVATSNIAAIEQVSTCLATNSLYASECSKECQITVANKSVDMAVQLRDMEVTIEEFKTASMGILSAIASVSTAAAHNLKNALITEYEMDQLSPEFFIFDTNLESKEKDYKASDKNKAEFLHTMNVHEALQREMAKKIAEKQEEVKKVINEVWAQKSLPGETNILRAPTFTMSLSNMQIDNIPGTMFQADAVPTNSLEINSSASTVTFTGQSSDKLFTKGQVEPGDTVAISVLATKNDAGRFAPTSDKLGDSSTFLSVSITNTLTGLPVLVEDTRNDFIIRIPREENKQGLYFKETEPVLASKSELFIHKAKISYKEASFHMEFDIANHEAQLLVVVKFGKKPSIEKNECDFTGLIPVSMKYRTSDPKETRFFLDNHQVNDFVGDVYVGVRQLEKKDYDKDFSDCSSLADFNTSDSLTAFRTNYSSRIYTSGCFFFDVPTQRWETDGLTVGPNTNSKVTECLSNHLTTFAGGWFVSPNTIDWDFVFTQADFYTNPTIYISEIAVASIYILSLILARRKDKRDVEKLGLTPLKDNHPNDKYYYEVIVFTGMRRNAGTDSKVFVIFSGENDETDARMLADDKRKVFRRGGVDRFLLAVHRPLGPLNYARIWHDNSGKGKFGSWFLKYIIVKDIQTDDRFVLVANKWFAVEEDDGQVDRVIPVAGQKQLTEFSHLFTEHSRKNLVDGHLWFSVMTRPPQSRFTCVQRVSCCLCLLFTTMLSNAMFYGIPQHKDELQIFIVGPFALTPIQVFIGVVSNLIVFPINFLIATLFRKSRARVKRPCRIEKALKSVQSASANDVKPVADSTWHKNKSVINLQTGEAGSRLVTDQFDKTIKSIDKQISKKTAGPKRKQKKKNELPWFCRMVAWTLLWLTTATSASFVTFYAIQFGDKKTKKWITSLLVSFLTSVFFTQPAKVFLTAMFVSLIFRNRGQDQIEEPEDEEDSNLSENKHLGEDEEYMHETSHYGPARPRKIGYQPPERAELERVKENRTKEIKMWDIVREIVFYSFFLWILLVISYRQRTSNSFFYKDTLEKLFIDNKNMEISFMKIRNTEEFWTWCQKDLVNGIRAGNYYNNYPPLLLRGFLEDKVSRIMGYAVLRQLRVKSGKCKVFSLVKHIIPSCNGQYSIFNEDKQDYNIYWSSLRNISNKYRTEYTYSKASKLNGYPYAGQLSVYSGGGYVMKLRESKWVLQRMMTRLQKEQWVDKHTRAIFIEFTAYNPQINLFAIITILVEIDGTGGVVPSYRIEPAMLLPYMSSGFLFQIFCEMVYFVFTVIFTFKEMKKIFEFKIKYFKCIWNLVELSIIALSLTAIIVYFYKFLVTSRLTSQFRRNKGKDYIKFQYVGYWNEIFSYIIGWLVFFGTLKFLKLLRFNKRISLLAATLKKGAKRLTHFSLIFWIVFLAFIQLFYLTFLSTGIAFSSFVSSIETGVLMIMGKLDIFSMAMVSPVISHIYVFLFVFTISFIVLNMFLSILNEAFANVRSGLENNSNDYEILSFMLTTFKSWTGFWEDNSNDKRDEKTRRKCKVYCNNASLADEEFPDRVDVYLTNI